MDNDLKNQIQQGIKDYMSSAQYGVTKIPSHLHNGVDTQQIPITSIVNSDLYVAVATVTLGSSQILTLHTTPVILVPAPGLGRCIVVESVFAKLTYAGTPYTVNNNFEFRYTDGSGSKVTADIPFGFSQSNTNAFIYAPGVSTFISMFANQPVVVYVPTGNLASGNSPITFVIKYRII